MLRVAVLVSGGGTNLQAIIDAVKDGHNYQYRACKQLISNNANAYALNKSKGKRVEALCISSEGLCRQSRFS